ncbi:MAG: transglycosylase domain-containing protein, partial [Bryobacteraceae bacterium]
MSVSLRSNPKKTPILTPEGSGFNCWLRLDETPPHVISAVVAVEDHRFLRHRGVDFTRATRAVWDGIISLRSPRGTSTITQQVARSVFLTRERTLSRKLKEVLIASYLEYKLTKQRILEIYLNIVPLGQIGPYPIEGLRAGSIAYLGKDITEVDVPEAALLAAMIQQPTYLNPRQRPVPAAERRDLVLRAMTRRGYLEAKDYKRMARRPLYSRPVVKEFAWTGHYYQLAGRELSALEAPEGPLAVELTLDAELQEVALAAVRRGMQRIDQAVSRRNSAKGVRPEVALVAMDAKTGGVLALVGGRDFLESQLNRAVARRQPGSTFKPFVYAAALEYGTREGPVGAYSLVADTPRGFSFKGELYQPNNYGGYINDLVTLQEALNRSLNVPAVRIAEAVGYSRVASLATRIGLDARVRGTPSVALGAYETTPLALAAAYATLANAGIAVQPYFVERVRTSDGRLIYRREPAATRVVSAATAAQITQMLVGVVNNGTAAPVRTWGFWLPAAGKTGTDEDGWFAGYTTALTCVVWVGYDDNRDLGLLGADSALPIWAEFMKLAHQLP